MLRWSLSKVTTTERRKRRRKGRWNKGVQQNDPSLMVNQGELIPLRRFTLDRLQLLMCQRCGVFLHMLSFNNLSLYNTICFIIQLYTHVPPQYTLLRHITQSHVCINTQRHSTLKHRYIQMMGDRPSWLLLASSFFLDGPVTVGMSLDIASIDTISEINMVRSYFYALLMNVIQQQTQNYLII